MPLVDVACAVLMTVNAMSVDSVTRREPYLIADSIRPAWTQALAVDTVPKPRARAVAMSSGYERRLTLHRRLSWTMLPLFAVAYVTGDQILSKGTAAPSWARSVHGPTATATAVLFGANTITGSLNLWEGRHNAAGRKRRLLHSLLFTASGAGFVYAGSRLADEAEQSQAKRLQHRNLTLASMGVSTASWLLMLVGN